MCVCVYVCSVCACVYVSLAIFLSDEYIKFGTSYIMSSSASTVLCMI